MIWKYLQKISGSIPSILVSGGNWREFYNIAAYREKSNVSGCSWMNYKLTGYCLTENKCGLMKVNKYTYDKPCTIDHFFVETDCCEIQPFFQQKVNRHYAGVVVNKLTSNLDIY